MSRLTLRLPETLHRQLETLAKRENTPLNQYIVYALTRQVTLVYPVQAISEEAVAQQRTDFTALLQSLGQASFEEIEKVMAKREGVEPERGLNPKVVRRLQRRLAGQHPAPIREHLRSGRSAPKSSLERNTGSGGRSARRR
jgi:predicted HicB family RNase H-like nuclease